MSQSQHVSITLVVKMKTVKTAEKMTGRTLTDKRKRVTEQEEEMPDWLIVVGEIVVK